MPMNLQADFPTIATTGPGMFTRVVLKTLTAQEQQEQEGDGQNTTTDRFMLVLPPSFFYPLPNTQRNASRSATHSYVRPETYAVHHWACSWVKNSENEPAANLET